MRTLDDLKLIAGEHVLVRVDFNVPVVDGEITDDSRIRAALPTIEELRMAGVKLILVAHLGRPNDREPELSLRPISERLSELLRVPVEFAPAVRGPKVEELMGQMKPGSVLMVENIRFEPGELKNDPALAADLAKMADVYINDAFGAAHRAHASTEGVAHHVSQVAAGRLLQREVQTLTQLLEDPRPPLVAVLGGAKVSDKIGVIKRFLHTADTILIGGAMCFPFLRAQGHKVGASLCEDRDVRLAQQVLTELPTHRCELKLPTDLVLGSNFAAVAERRVLTGLDVPDGWMGLDIGPVTSACYRECILKAGTVFWNGPMGAFEFPNFAAGTKEVAAAVAETDAITVVGGGDSAAALYQSGYADQVTHLSTGGGAALELLEGNTLPGIAILQ